MRRIIFAISGLLVVLLTGCLKNDIPYPIIEARITEFATDNMVEQPKIDATNRTITLTIGDSIDIRNVRITKLLFTEQASLSVPDSSLLHNANKFPVKPFASLKDLPMSADTHINMERPYVLQLSTYQDYNWTVMVSQVIEREVRVQGQVGNAIIDADEHKVVLYVNADTPLSRVQVETFTLGGKYGKVVPNPCDEQYLQGYNFDTPQDFYVRFPWEETSTVWRVYVYQAEKEIEVHSEAFARTVSATLSTTGASADLTLAYKEETAGSWTPVTNLRTKGKKTTAELTALKPATTYAYRWSKGTESLETGTFTTTEATPLTDGLLDNWHKADKLWNPWSESAQSFWDTGNKGATTVGESNSVPTDDTATGSGQAACLQSKYIVLKFASGNLFTGRYVKTDGTNGILEFGRPFTAFPTSLKFSYKYRSEIINRVGDDDLQYLKGRPDSCHVYIYLADWEQPFTIKTRKSERSLIDPIHDDHVLAYGQMTTAENSDQYQTVELPLHYKITNRRPKYIVIVASASKYGDYFTGGEGSVLWVDNFELKYE